jgi:transposase
VVPRNHGPNVTLLAALSLEGSTAAMTMTGPADGEVVGLFVRRILLPTLPPGQIVLWDNLSAHTNAALRQLIAERGCEVRFLPPYSPDCNPIEHAFSKLKTALRRAEARTRETLEDAIAAGLDTITPSAAQAWFRHCGYAVPEQLL